MLYVCMNVCMCVYVCVYICMYVCVYVCMYICMCVYMYVCMYVCVYVCMYVCMCVCMYVCVYVCMFVCMYVCMCVCMYVCVCVRLFWCAAPFVVAEVSSAVSVLQLLVVGEGNDSAFSAFAPLAAPSLPSPPRGNEYEMIHHCLDNWFPNWLPNWLPNCLPNWFPNCFPNCLPNWLPNCLPNRGVTCELIKNHNNILVVVFREILTFSRGREGGSYNTLWTFIISFHWLRDVTPVVGCCAAQHRALCSRASTRRCRRWSHSPSCWLKVSKASRLGITRILPRPPLDHLFLPPSIPPSLPRL